MSQPTLTTARLTLRPFVPSDAALVAELAGAREVADTTRNIPHPYLPEMAEQWISAQPAAFTAGSVVTFAISSRSDATLYGAISLRLALDDKRAEMGYWLGVPYWGKGYTTEAAAAIVDYGFSEWQLNRIYASHITRNPASGRVMQKIGMRYEGCLRQHFIKWGAFDDLAQYAILREEWPAAHVGPVG